MNTELINKVTKKYQSTSNIDRFGVGDTVTVETLIRDGDKTRTQKFTGLVISIKGSGMSKTFTVRKISYGVGVEKIFPYNSPNVASVSLEKTGRPRRAKLYYLRDRVGKQALKVKVGPHRSLEEKQVPEVEAVSAKDEEVEVSEEK